MATPAVHQAVREPKEVLEHHTKHPRKASDIIDPFGISKGDEVILVCRVSGCQQRRNKNLEDQERNLREIAERKGGIVREEDTVRHTGSGKNPWWLAEAAGKARETGAILLAESTDRFIRHRDYHSKTNPDAQAGARELADLQGITRGAKMMTAVHPDASPGEVRSFQRKRGQRQKESKGGRPMKEDRTNGYKKRRRERLLPRAAILRKEGKSMGEIARILSISKPTIQGWLNRIREGKQ